MTVAAVHPQQTAKPPGEDVLAVARALAKLHARLDHEAELARSKDPIWPTQKSSPTRAMPL
jgi:hypothetical protein